MTTSPPNSSRRVSTIVLIMFVYFFIRLKARGDDVEHLFSRGIPTLNQLSEIFHPLNQNISVDETGSSLSSSQHYFYRQRIDHSQEESKRCWIDIQNAKSVMRKPLNSFKAGLNVSLTFAFPFYGYFIENVTITNKGSLIIEDLDLEENIFGSSIIPLMMEYDSEWRKSTILYSDNGISFTIQWDKLRIQMQGSTYIFTFQVTLFDNGKIIFAYKQMPLSLTAIRRKGIDVKVGMYDLTSSSRRLQVDLSSHHLDLSWADISNSTCIYLTPLLDWYKYEVDQENGYDAFAASFENIRVVREIREAIDSDEEDKSVSDYSGWDYGEGQVTIPPDELGHTLRDHHHYYNSTVYSKNNKWVELWTNLDNTNDQNIHFMLSNSYRKGVTVPLTFDFPFYGHRIRNITITTGGFLFTGTQVHSWLAATQYIAPLMANFDPSLKNSSVVKYYDNGTAFTVQWENVTLKDKTEAGHFTFQVTLLNSGDIAFVYKQIPLAVTLISDDAHPVKVGLSDAYIIDRTIFFSRRKTIYEYHRVDLRKPTISNSTSIYFTALPTCVSMKDCQSCVQGVEGFECVWCSDRCSDGIDRHRQHWILQGCGQNPEQKCPEIPTISSEAKKSTQGHGSAFSEVSSTLSSLFPANSPAQKAHSSLDDAFSSLSPQKVDAYQSGSSKYSGDGDYMSLGTAGIVGVLFATAVVVAFLIWVFYAYRNPHTSSGQFLIRYRPNQWHWPQTEARYTAAAVHM